MRLHRNQGNLAVMLVIVACTASTARADFVSFSPVGGSSTVSPGQVLEVDASLQLTVAIESVGMAVFLDATTGSLDFGSGNAPDFGYHAGFLAATVPPGNLFTPDFLSRRVENIGGFFGSGPVGPGLFPVGRFAIDTTGMPLGTYSLFVDEADSQATTELGDAVALSGSFFFTVAPSIVPAPGAFLLGAVGLGFVGWLRRRTA